MTKIKWPQSNLPSVSRLWGRKVESSIDRLDKTLTNNSTSINRALTTMSKNVNRLISQQRAVLLNTEVIRLPLPLVEVYVEGTSGSASGTGNVSYDLAEYLPPYSEMRKWDGTVTVTLAPEIIGGGAAGGSGSAEWYLTLGEVNDYPLTLSTVGGFNPNDTSTSDKSMTMRISRIYDYDKLKVNASLDVLDTGGYIQGYVFISFKVQRNPYA